LPLSERFLKDHQAKYRHANGCHAIDVSCCVWAFYLYICLKSLKTQTFSLSNNKTAEKFVNLHLNYDFFVTKRKDVVLQVIDIQLNKKV